MLILSTEFVPRQSFVDLTVTKKSFNVVGLASNVRGLASSESFEVRALVCGSVAVDAPSSVVLDDFENFKAFVDLYEKTETDADLDFNSDEVSEADFTFLEIKFSDRSVYFDPQGFLYPRYIGLTSEAL